MTYRDAIPRSFGELALFFRAAFWRFWDDRCLQVAGSLTYTTLLSLVPLIAVALAAATAFPVFSEWTGKLDEYMLENFLPEEIGNVILTYVTQFAEKAGRLTAVGIVFLAITAVMLMGTIDRAFNQIWRVARPRPLLQGVLIYWAVLTLGPVLIGASITMTSYLVSQSLGLAQGVPFVGELVLAAVPVLLTCIALTLLYAVVPNRRVRLRHALIGGFIAGLLFEAMKRGFAFYVAQFPTYTLVYGTFAAIPMFLLWLYLSWSVVLLGASITALLPGYRFGGRHHAPGTRFFEALELLEALIAAQAAGRATPLAELALGTRLAPESAERLLERMRELGWVQQATGDRWLLGRDAGEILVADVWHGFVLDPQGTAERAGRAGAAPLVEAIERDVAASMALSVKALIASPEKVTRLQARGSER